MLSGAELSAERIAAEVDELIAAAGELGLTGARPRWSTRCATPARPSSCRSRARRARPGRPDRALRARPTRSATATATPRARSSSSTSAWRWSSPGPSRARAAAGGRPLEESARAGPLRRRVGRDAGAARRAARPASRAEGPVVFELPEATLVLPPGWSAHGRRGRHDRRAAGRRVMEHEQLDPITLQVLLGGLRAACEEMGAALIRSAYSANIKERRDCSTALFDAARRAGDAGRAHPRPPRLDARRGRRGARRGAAAPASPGSSTTPTAAAPTCPTSP